MRVTTGALLLILLSFTGPVLAAERWITHPVAAKEPKSSIVLQFRRDIHLADVPKSLPVRVSADNRYVLFINGKRVAAGPARGDLAHWRSRRIDLAPFLKPGRNVLAAQVWNDGRAAAHAQISARTAFLLTGEEGWRVLETGPDWRVRIDASRSVSSGPAHIKKVVGERPYYAAAPPETHVAAARQPDWLAPETKADDWLPAVDAVSEREASPWKLVEDQLPPMEFRQLPAGKTVRAHGIEPASFPQQPITVSAHSKAILLIDAGMLQAAYPTLVVSGGEGAEVTVTYTEALYGKDRNYLKDRSAVAGGVALRLTDTFRADGSDASVFQPFWWRAWRFAELRVQTGAEPLRLESFTRYATGYPFSEQASFESSDPELNRIWQVGWNTVRVDAHETFMDTAYWEQLQYIGDTRIQALITYLVSGDPRLAVQAIEAFDASRRTA